MIQICLTKSYTTRRRSCSCNGNALMEMRILIYFCHDVHAYVMKDRKNGAELKQ